jgi:hypothetical protein
VTIIVDDVLAGAARWIVGHGDNADLLPFIPDESIDAVITDPPAGIAFMATAARTWDRFADRDAFVGEMTRVFREALRVLKPGGHALVWALPRTSSWTARALEDAGFEVRDEIPHIFGQGFPKSLDVSKAIDKAAGVERRVVGTKIGMPGVAADGSNQGRGFGRRHEGRTDEPGISVDVTAPATDAAKRWAGWGTALKPAQEKWILARKPLAGTVVANVLAHGTGAINIDDCRVFTDWSERSEAWKRSGHSSKPEAEKVAAPPGDGITCHPGGRWPPNAALSHAPCCRPVGERTIKASGYSAGFVGEDATSPSLGKKRAQIRPETVYSSPNGTETVRAWECLAACSCGLTTRAPTGGAAPMCDCGEPMWWACPVAELDAQSGVLVSGSRAAGVRTGLGYGGATVAGGPAVMGGSGGASRFFPSFHPLDAPLFIYAAKASTADKSDGLDGRNTHPTVKSTGLMRRLCRLVTPPSGIVLDMFTGSGSTGVAALIEGFRFIGIERDPVHVEEARARCAQAERDLAEERTGQGKLFGTELATSSTSRPSAPSPRSVSTAPLAQPSLFDLRGSP